VRPVRDFRELNSFVSSHTAESDICHEKHGRRMGDQFSAIDSRKAYLQFHVDPKVRKYQVVSYKGKFCCLTWLSFSLNVAP
jgi:L-amino acid N-acyltransferase YncA